MILNLIILIITISFFEVNAQEYIPYKNSPIILKEPTHNGYVQPHVIKESDHFAIWFADNDGIRHRIVRMLSTNGVDWYKKTDTNVSQRNNVHDPFIFFDKNEYILFFASSNFGNISLWRSTSQDGITFTPGKELEILKSQAPWEGSHLSCPSVIKNNELYHLFYSGSGVSNWGIGLATSLDGISWQRCQNNPIVAPGASAQIVTYNGKFFLFFQSPNGLEVQETDSLNGCTTIWTNRHIIKNILRDPSPVVVNDNLWLYGTHSGNDGLNIGLASKSEIFLPKYPVVIVPGMFASWNSRAILHNEQVSSDTWFIQPGVKEYEALNGTLKNLGYTQNENVYIFSYDWRQSISKTIKDLDDFLIKNIWGTYPYQPVQFIGHSLGGTILRQYVKENSSKPIKKLVTVGSPHLGAIQAYKPIAAGEIDRENTLMWLAQKIILLLNKSKVESDKITINRLLPVLNDLLPIFPYLKNEKGENVQSIHKNHILTTQSTVSTIPQLYLGSSNSKIEAGYLLISQTPLEQLTNIYEDGHPHNTWKEDGDGVILLKSTLNQYTPIPSLNHGEIIFNKENLKVILSALDINVKDDQITPGQETKIFPAIFAFIQSPATMKIEYGDKIEHERQGMIWLQNTKNMIYKLKVTGAADGEYTLSIWLIGESEDKWIQYKSRAKYMSEDIYTISFDEKYGGTVQSGLVISPTNSPTSTPITNIAGPDPIHNSTNSIQPTTSIAPTSMSNTQIRDIFTQPSNKFETNESNNQEGESNVLGISNEQINEGGISMYLVGMIIILILVVLVFIYKQKYLGFFVKILRSIKSK